MAALRFAFVVLATALASSPAIAVPADGAFPEHSVVGGDRGVVRVAQLFGDALLCAFEPFDDVCLANELNRMLDAAPPGAADEYWALWYHTLLVSRDELILVPVTDSATANMNDPGYISTIRAARTAFSGDVDMARSEANLIEDEVARVRAYLGLAEALLRSDDIEGAQQTLDSALIIATAIAPSSNAIPVSEEIAWTQLRAGNLAGAAAAHTLGMSANESLSAPGFIKAANALSLAGTACHVEGREEGVRLIEDGLTALEALPVVPRLVMAVTQARAARGYERCGMPEEADLARRAAIDLAPSLDLDEQAAVIANLIVLPISP